MHSEKLYILIFAANHSCECLTMNRSSGHLLYVKAHVNTDEAASTDGLEDSMEAFIREIPAETMPKFGYAVGSFKAQ